MGSNRNLQTSSLYRCKMIFSCREGKSWNEGSQPFKRLLQQTTTEAKPRLLAGSWASFDPQGAKLHIAITGITEKPRGDNERRWDLWDDGGEGLEIWEVLGWKLISRFLVFNVFWCFFVFLIPTSGRIPICDYSFSDGLTPSIRWKQGVLMEMVLLVDGGTKFSL